MLGGHEDTSEKTKLILEKIKNATGGGEEADGEMEDPDEEMEQEPEDDDFEGDEDEMAGDYDGGNLQIFLLRLDRCYFLLTCFTEQYFENGEEEEEDGGDAGGDDY